MKQMEVAILGQSYILACPEGGETTLLAAVDKVDREMSAIRDGGKVRSRERMAVLAALNLAYELADRPTAASVTAAPAASARPGAQVGHGGPGMAAAADAAQIEALVQRIDAALGHDGQLL